MDREDDHDIDDDDSPTGAAAMSPDCIEACRLLWSVANTTAELHGVDFGVPTDDIAEDHNYVPREASKAEVFAQLLHACLICATCLPRCGARLPHLRHMSASVRCCHLQSCLLLCRKC